MLDWMQTGRFKVIADQNDWLEEYRLYHHKDGKVVKLGDDLMAATRYAFMMRRFAQRWQPPRTRPRDPVPGERLRLGRKER